MALYFFLHDAAPFHQAVVPALAASWHSRSFGPCRPLAASLKPAIQAFSQRYHTGPEMPLLTQIDHGLPFDRALWRLLAGEILLYGARDIPEIQTAPETLCCLLAPERCGQGPASREQLARIEQAHFGTRDLIFGSGYYRPEHAGWNDPSDVERLAAYLAGVDPGKWTPADLTPLAGLGPDDRAEELEFARERFADLRDLYGRAREEDLVVIGEDLS